MKPCKKRTEFTIRRNPRVSSSPIDVISKARVATVDCKYRRHTVYHSRPSSFFEPVEFDWAGTLSNHMTLNIYLSDIPDTPPATKHPFIWMIVWEAENLQFCTIRSLPQFIAKLKQAFKDTIIITICRNNCGIDDLTIVCDLQVKLKSVKMRHLNRIETNGQGPRRTNPFHTEQVLFKIIQRRKNQKLKITKA